MCFAPIISSSSIIFPELFMVIPPALYQLMNDPSSRLLTEVNEYHLARPFTMAAVSHISNLGNHLGARKGIGTCDSNMDFLFLPHIPLQWKSSVDIKPR